MAQTITVKQHAATATKPTRLSATNGKKKIYRVRDYEECLEQQFMSIAAELRDLLKWSRNMSGGHIKEGMIFVFTGDYEIN